MSIYFTSDHHFGHAGALGLYRRPFASVAEMDREMIDGIQWLNPTMRSGIWATSLSPLQRRDCRRLSKSDPMSCAPRRSA